MKGHMEDGKFHPHTDYKKGTRKSRDQKSKTQGVKIRKKRTPEELKKFKLNELELIWRELDFAQRGGALERIFPPTKKEEMEVRWSLRPQFKNAHTESVSKLAPDVQNGLINFYKERIDEAVEITEMKPMGSFEDAFTKAFQQAQTRKKRDLPRNFNFVHSSVIADRLGIDTDGFVGTYTIGTGKNVKIVGYKQGQTFSQESIKRIDPKIKEYHIRVLSDSDSDYGKIYAINDTIAKRIAGDLLQNDTDFELTRIETKFTEVN